MFRIFAAAVLGIIGTGSALGEETAWAPAKAGMVECFAGNFDQKTCKGLTSYAWKDDGTVLAEARFYKDELVPGVVIITSSTAVIEGNLNCTTLTPAYAQTARFEVDGKSVSDEKTARYRDMLAKGMKDMMNKKVCARIGLYGRDYTVQITVDGREMPSLSNWLAFVEKDGGFTLKP